MAAATTRIPNLETIPSALLDYISARLDARNLSRFARTSQFMKSHLGKVMTSAKTARLDEEKILGTFKTRPEFPNDQQYIDYLVTMPCNDYIAERILDKQNGLDD